MNALAVLSGGICMGIGVFIGLWICAGLLKLKNQQIAELTQSRDLWKNNSEIWQKVATRTNQPQPSRKELVN